MQMKTLRMVSTLALVGTLGLAASTALATPTMVDITYNLRVFNDDPNSNLNATDTWPAGPITISDLQLDGDGTGGEFANLHNWRFSADGLDDAQLQNGDGFRMTADLTLTGSRAEAGLQVSPWWSPNVDGRLQIKTSDLGGEIAAFGGRLPFYSFTANHGLTYTTGDTITLEITYVPRDLDAIHPALIEYAVNYNGNDYSSGYLAFDEGNPNEDPPHGTWGLLQPFEVGGVFQPQIDVGNQANGSTAVWDNVTFVPEPATLALLALGGLAVVRRKRIG